ncbi:hypothetical protein [Vibrio phage J14]|nr:hypothetical protein [Vibrio phage J14]
MIDFTVETENAVAKISALMGDMGEALDEEQILDDAASLIFSRTVRRFRSRANPRR